MAMQRGGTSDSFVKGLVIVCQLSQPINCVFIKAFYHFKPTLCLWSSRYLFPTKGKSTKRKTPVVKKNLDPHYDHTFVYKDLALEQLREMCLELTVWDKEAMLSNEFLGGVRLSSVKGRKLKESNKSRYFICCMKNSFFKILRYSSVL